MVFVNSRKSTVSSANVILDEAREEGTIGLFTQPAASRSKYYDDLVQKCGNRDIMELYEYGIGIHHAGLRRNERYSPRSPSNELENSRKTSLPMESCACSSVQLP